MVFTFCMFPIRFWAPQGQGWVTHSRCSVSGVQCMSGPVNEGHWLSQRGLPASSTKAPHRDICEQRTGTTTLVFPETPGASPGAQVAWASTHMWAHTMLPLSHACVECASGWYVLWRAFSVHWADRWHWPGKSLVLRHSNKNTIRRHTGQGWRQPRE